MLMQYFTNDSERYFTHRYLLEHMGGTADCATRDSSDLERLDEGDQLVIASANILTANPLHLVLVITELTHRGVCIHFAKESCIFYGKRLEATNETLQKVLALLMDLPSSHPGSMERATTRVHAGSHGRAGREPSKRQHLLREGRSGCFDRHSQCDVPTLTMHHFDMKKLIKKINIFNINILFFRKYLAEISMLFGRKHYASR